MDDNNKTGSDFDQSVIDRLFLSQPCAQEAHFPFKIAWSKGEGGIVPYGVVRIGSIHGWDGCGGRTDLHDILGLAWAASLRATGAASSTVWLDVGWAGKPEISSRILLFDQPYGSAVAEAKSGELVSRLNAHTAWAAHALTDIFRFAPVSNYPPKWSDERKPRWIRGLVGSQKNGREDLWITRKNPDWEYYTDTKNKCSVVRLAKDSRVLFNDFLHFYRPVSAQIGTKFALYSNGIINCIDNTTIEIGVDALHKIEGRSSLKWLGPTSIASENSIVALPLESHCLFFGSRTIVAVNQPCGFIEFDNARAEWKRENARQSRIFNINTTWKWASKIDPKIFEEMIEALLTEEPGLKWVRSTGPTYERDQGRDLLAMWLTPPGLGENLAANAAESAIKVRRIIIQCKAKTKTISKKDFQDVRDTVERHSAEGILLVAFPGWSNDLFNYLEGLAVKGVWVNVWGRSQIEERLRRYPHIAERFAACVQQDG